MFVRLTADQALYSYYCLYYPTCKSYLCGAILCVDRQLFLWSARFCHLYCNCLVNGTFFSRKSMVKIKSFFLFSLRLLSETFANPWSFQRSIINLCLSSCKVSLLPLIRFEEKWIWSTNFSENPLHKTSWKFDKFGPIRKGRRWKSEQLLFAVVLRKRLKWT
jgi:hypothetical protein